jgi:hypothetical protein
MIGILGGARAQEKAGEEAGKKSASGESRREHRRWIQRVRADLALEPTAPMSQCRRGSARSFGGFVIDDRGATGALMRVQMRADGRRAR